MTDKRTNRALAPGAAARSRRFRRRELQVAGRGTLVLDVDGSIHQLDDRGTTIRTWEPTDPEWPSEAIRFGLHAQAPTVAPHGRVPDTKPPRR
jgi:hypothetical protein